MEELVSELALGDDKVIQMLKIYVRFIFCIVHPYEYWYSKAISHEYECDASVLKTILWEKLFSSIMDLDLKLTN